MASKRPLDSDALLSGDETEALLALLSDVAQGHGDDEGVRQAASAGWALLSNRVVSQHGYGATREDSYYEGLLERMQHRDRPWHTRK
ncbi:hypothetical protein [Saccharopolyspora phatthalungensis]|uniref:Uncharacterized protein n=1 Tax=Saccharopolyspora phatthalungensis TaxID=664693 RepID=A0A840Q4P0_9PSEU|nr:hypothetical protein [Saccharopolyspora phatthalungensis]MBB5157472.1 hypothetical protein [Saccharopolyspora phatthalungensis]